MHLGFPSLAYKNCFYAENKDSANSLESSPEILLTLYTLVGAQ
jgi:hypothetical protein